ncbi:MAG: LytR family transcriptional regulator [Ruminococcaceae bacterium]|nr:LytR family transcriptional regulator [Oscillospiraceae bacterium]
MILSAVRNFVITLLISLLIFGLVAFGILQFADGALFGRGGNSGNGGNGNGGNVTTTEPDLPPPPDGFDAIKGKSMTVLFIGTDYLPDVYYDYEYVGQRPDGFDGELREIETDTIILARINKETGEAIFCPIPAITQITINGHSTTLEKLYYQKGISALREQVTALTGLPIDYHAIVTIDGLSHIIDDLGGIEFHVPQDMNYVDLEQQIEIDLKSGTQVLDGKNATDMLRYWSYSDEDVSRRRVGCNFLKAIIKKVMTDIPMNDAASAFFKYQEYISTDLTINALNENADLIFAYPKLTVRDYTYPGTTTGKGLDAVFTPNVSKATEFFDAYKFKG